MIDSRDDDVGPLEQIAEYTGPDAVRRCSGVGIGMHTVDFAVILDRQRIVHGDPVTSTTPVARRGEPRDTMPGLGQRGSHGTDSVDWSLVDSRKPFEEHLIQVLVGQK